MRTFRKYVRVMDLWLLDDSGVNYVLEDSKDADKISNHQLDLEDLVRVELDSIEELEKVRKYLKY